MGGGIADRGGTADRVAEEHGAVDGAGVEQARQQVGVADGAGRDAIGVGATLPGPVRRDDTPARRQPGAQGREVAGTVADGVQADDGRSAALVVDRQVDAVDGDAAGGGRRADGRSQALHSDGSITRDARGSTVLDPRPMARRLPPPRPRRGSPAATRARLVEAAARLFNRDGFHGTDSNRIARAAGYAPGSFYKHFADKRAIFLEVYEGWVTAEWQAVERAIAAGGSAEATAARIVALLLAFHRRWRGFRASLRALVATDAAARRCHRRQRARQLKLLREMRVRLRDPARSAEEDALLLFTLERVCDAAADGELRDLGLSSAAMVRRLEGLVRAQLGA